MATQADWLLALRPDGGNFTSRRRLATWSKRTTSAIQTGSTALARSGHQATRVSDGRP